MSNVIYCDKSVSRRKAIEAATQLIFHLRTVYGLTQAMTYDELRAQLALVGLGYITPAEMSDIWRHSSYFEPDLDEPGYDGLNKGIQEALDIGREMAQR